MGHLADLLTLLLFAHQKVPHMFLSLGGCSLWCPTAPTQDTLQHSMWHLAIPLMFPLQSSVSARHQHLLEECHPHLIPRSTIPIVLGPPSPATLGEPQLTWASPIKQLVSPVGQDLGLPHTCGSPPALLPLTSNASASMQALWESCLFTPVHFSLPGMTLTNH